MALHTEIIQRERTESALAQSEALKSAILQTALDAIVTIDHEGRVLDFNPAAERIFGYAREEALGLEMAEIIIPPRLRERHRLGLQRAVQSGTDTIVGRRIEITAVRKSGEEFPVELAITRIATSGQPIFTGHIRDITERQRAEQLQAAQYAIARVLAEAPTLAAAAPGILRAVCEGLGWNVGAIWRVNDSASELRCVDVCNDGALAGAEFLGVTRQISFGRSIGLPGRIWASGEPIWIPDVTEDTNFPRAELAARDSLHSAFGFPIRLGAVVLGVIEFFSREIRRPDADVLAMFGSVGSQIGQFIERKEAEERLRHLNADLERRITARTAELKESQARFSKAFQASPAFVSIARASDGHFVEVNAAFLESSGFTAEEVLGKTSADLNLWVDLEERTGFLAELERRGFVRNRETVLRGKRGRLDTVLLSAELIEIDGRPHILAVGQNITARKKAEEELRRTLEQEKELSRLKSNFISLVSHEFRTPLGVILSSADILDSYFDRLTAERRREHLADIRGASQLMSGLMEEVLFLGRMEAGRVEPKLDTVHLKDFCQQIISDAISATARRCPIALVDEKIPARARADESLLRHILTNLLSNAVKYSPAGREVRLELTRRREDAVFRVVDGGIGIPESDLPLLFQTFQRGGNVANIPGTGLGLVLVKRCVELHGGSIAVQSKLGEGTTVTVTLPMFPQTKPRKT